MPNRVPSALRQIGPGLLLRGAGMIALLVGAGYLINQFSFEDLAARFALREGMGGNQLAPRAVYLVLGLLFTAAGGPRQAVSFFAAYFFGLGEGFILALIATLGGAAAALTAAVAFGGIARQVIRGRADIAARMWAEHAFSVTLVVRLLPVGSNLVTNLAAGIARIPVLPFMAGSALGYMPQTLVFALMGSGVNIGSELQVGLSVVLFVVSTLLGVWIYARQRRKLKAAGRD